LEKLPRKAIAEQSIQHSRAILLENITQCVSVSNQYAPEHLIIATDDAEEISKNVSNAGSVFLGKYSCESAGDYASGTNHTLPTNGFARNYSGVSVESFTKKIFFQELSEKGIVNLGEAIELMAEAEQLMAHKNAVSIRLEYLISKNNK
jgi:histidinol dehydrogenase